MIGLYQLISPTFGLFLTHDRSLLLLGALEFGTGLLHDDKDQGFVEEGQCYYTVFFFF